MTFKRCGEQVLSANLKPCKRGQPQAPHYTTEGTSHHATNLPLSILRIYSWFCPTPPFLFYRSELALLYPSAERWQYTDAYCLTSRTGTTCNQLAVSDCYRQVDAMSQERETTMRAQPTTPTTPTVTHDVSSASRIDGNAAIAPAAITLLLFLTLIISLIAHRRYRQQIMQRRITTLEKLWALSSKEPQF